MKDNKEFLKGVYRKADLLEKEKFKRRVPYKGYIRYSSVAAIFIILPLLFFNRGIMIPYRDISSQEPRMISINDSIVNFADADFILIGETKIIEDSIFVKEENYIYTDIIISVDQIFLGEIKKGQIKVRVDGGKVKKEKLLSEIKANFNKGERSLLFLYKDEGNIYYLVNNSGSQFREVEDDIFIDYLGNKYGLEDIKKNINER